MKKHLLLLSIMLVFLVSFRNSDYYSYSDKRSMLSGDPLVKIDDPLLLPSPGNSFPSLAGVGDSSPYGVSQYCQEVGIINIMDNDALSRGITFYNHSYQKYLSRQGNFATGTNKLIIVDDYYTNYRSKATQTWFFKLLYQVKPEYGGWPFKLITATYMQDSKFYLDVPDQNAIVYNNDLVTLFYSPRVPLNKGRFEFVITEGRINCRQPRG